MRIAGKFLKKQNQLSWQPIHNGQFFLPVLPEARKGVCKMRPFRVIPSHFVKSFAVENIYSFRPLISWNLLMGLGQFLARELLNHWWLAQRQWEEADANEGIRNSDSFPGIPSKGSSLSPLVRSHAPPRRTAKAFSSRNRGTRPAILIRPVADLRNQALAALKRKPGTKRASLAHRAQPQSYHLLAIRTRVPISGTPL